MTKSSHGLGKKIIVVGITIILLLSAGVFYWWQKKQISWVEYRNPKYFYSLNYPANWMLEAQNPITVSIKNPETSLKKEAGYDVAITYYSSVKSAWGVESLEEGINKNKYVSNSKKIKIAEQEAWEMIMSGDDKNIKAYVVLVEKNGHLYQISFNHTDITAIEKKILESFKFTNN